MLYIIFFFIKSFIINCKFCIFYFYIYNFMLCVEKSLKNDNVYYDLIFELLEVVRNVLYELVYVLILK